MRVILLIELSYYLQGGIMMSKENKERSIQPEPIPDPEPEPVPSPEPIPDPEPDPELEHKTQKQDRS